MVQRIEIESVIKNLSLIETFLNEKLKEFHIPRKIYCKLYLAVTEAISNAILHGNKEDFNRKVILEFRNNTDFYEFDIWDQGDGFDYTNLPDPRSPKNLKKESGRGVFIMKEYADKVVFKNNGSHVNLIFNK